MRRCIERESGERVMMRFLLVMVISVLTAAGAVAAEASAVAPEPDVKPGHTPEPGKPVDFSAGKKLRDPFWPVGHVRAGAAVVVVQRDTEEEWRKKALSMLNYGGSIHSKGKYYATVNGTMVQAGDVIAVTVDKRVFKFRVLSIDMKGIRFKSADR